MTTVTQNKQTQSLCVLRVMMASKKIRLDRPAITEILVADTDSESGAESSDDDEFHEFEEEEEEEEQQQQQQQQEQEASAQEDEPQAAKEWRRVTNLGTASRKEHKNRSIRWSSKRLEKQWGSTHQQRQLTAGCVDAVFTENFQLLVEQINLYYQQHLDRQAGPSRRLPDITLPDMTFTALALQMGHNLQDTLHGYWSRLKQLHTPFYGETMRRDRFLHILRFLHFFDWIETQGATEPLQQPELCE